jgi:tellurite methyltransferase
MSLWDQFWNESEEREWWQTPAPDVLELIRSHSAQQRPRVLDLGCGLGRPAIAFAQAGFSVTAIDSSVTAIQYLREWANRLGLEMLIFQGDVLDPRLPEGYFDIVLSYNVIYHGFREQFKAAIQHVSQLLKPGGLFYFTCPTREDGKYGFGEQTAPYTYLSTKSILPGDIHYFSDEADLDELLKDFILLTRLKDEGHFINRGQEQFFSNWQVLVQKP